MIAGDVLFAYLGLALGFFLRFHTPLKELGVPAENLDFVDYQALLGLAVLFLVLTYSHLNLYSWKVLLRPRRFLPGTLQGTTFWFVVFACFSIVLKFEPQISRFFMIISWFSVLLLISGWKYGFYRVLQSSQMRANLVQKIVVLGWNEESATLTDAIYRDHSHPYSVQGLIHGTHPEGETDLPNTIYPVLGGLHDLETIFEKQRPDILVIADLDLNREQLGQIAKLCEIHYVQMKIVPTMFQIFLSGLRLETVSGRPLLGIEELAILRPVNQLAKRVMDIIGGLVGLIGSFPVMAIIAFLIYREDPGPILYRQLRTGRNGRPFTIYKLRSMRTDAEKGKAQWAVENDPRRLKVGAFMRAWNIDELPQFWNILKGEMSLVGPRPERPELIVNFERNIDHYNHRHVVKPGLTGWAQINGLRGNTSLADRIRYDIYYIDNWNIFMDVYICLMTFLKQENAY
ncbi:MAG: exopolysaccharide biosynthesis polyprenyl glycosylphosphotransferase [Puniceicoccaceae bacterium 5H]|nr:MAG: exopolysaccharide biosynthesis polyprenyl glycosylphosphotransferase [Puniceicoccaceae bacterium 5H]